MDIQEKLSKARSLVILDAPFFGCLLLTLKFEHKNEVQTMATDGEHIYYCEDFVNKLTVQELMGVMAHEILHIVYEHHLRLGNREHGRFNKAGDYCINEILEKNKFTLPSCRLRDPNFDEMSADEIYNKLPQDQNGGGGNDPGGCGSVIQPTKNGKQLSKTEIDKLSSQIKQKIIQAANTAKNYGTLPAGLERKINEIINPRVDCWAILEQFIQKTAKNDFRTLPPNRRYVPFGLYLPSLISDELPEIAITIDTSGSIIQEDLQSFSDAINGLKTLYRVKLTALYCDTQINKVDIIEPEDLFTPTMVGGGGTDFKPPFKWIEDNGITPTCFVYITDLECNSFPQEPDYPVLWIIKGDNKIPPFGEYCYL